MRMITVSNQLGSLRRQALSGHALRQLQVARLMRRNHRSPQKSEAVQLGIWTDHLSQMQVPKLQCAGVSRGVRDHI